ncbi:response regulator [Flavobacterium psychrotolerans]|nr:response regulator [Flavobacterium psychrotolerans]
MPAKKNILIVDDHPMSVDGYVMLLSSIEINKNAKYHLAYNCKEAYNLLKELETNNTAIDIAFFDINMPPYDEKKIMSGTDLAVLLRKTSPASKIVILSYHEEPILVNKIFKSIKPEGFISKGDVNYRFFPEVYKKIMDNDFYFSPSIIKSQKHFIQKDFKWDEHDSKIVLLISQGIKTINLPKYIPLSLSAIEKRKANIKKQLVFGTGTDLKMLEILKTFGFI